MTNIVFVLSVVVGVGALAWGYGIQGHTEYARWFFLFGAVWLLAKWRGWKWISPLALLIVIASAAYGLWIEIPFGWMMFAAVGGLLAWDLDDFSRRLSYAAPSDDVIGMERRHIARVGIVAVLGGALGFIAFVVRIQLPFEVVVGLVILTVLGLTRLITTLRRD
ncbi:MAG: hypothetical protein MUO77_09345 [Anaerolineales bacterium]|nr:hypothetical protein [Anaerolineales bacterium]